MAHPKPTIRLKCVHLLLWTTRKIEQRAMPLGTYHFSMCVCVWGGDVIFLQR